MNLFDLNIIMSQLEAAGFSSLQVNWAMAQDDIETVQVMLDSFLEDGLTHNEAISRLKVLLKQHIGDEKTIWKNIDKLVLTTKFNEYEYVWQLLYLAACSLQNVDRNTYEAKRFEVLFKSTPIICWLKANLRVLNNYTDVNSEEVQWLLARNYRQVTFNSVVNELDDETEKLVPNPFALYECWAAGLEPSTDVNPKGIKKP